MIYLCYPNSFYNYETAKKDFYINKFIPFLKDNLISFKQIKHYITVNDESGINLIKIVFGDYFSYDMLNNVYYLNSNVSSFTNLD